MCFCDISPQYILRSWPLVPLLPFTLLPYPEFPGAIDAVFTIAKTEGVVAMYKGLVPTLLGVAPYAAINFASYDLAKKWLYHGER